MGEKTGLHPVVVIVSIFFWGTALGGILGMIFGIPLTALLFYGDCFAKIFSFLALLNSLSKF